MQNDLEKIYDWSLLWEMEFNTKKCHVFEMGKSKKRPTGTYKIGRETITKSEEEKDLGVTILDSLSPENHINRIFGSTYSMLINIRVAFTYMDKDMMRKIITTMINGICSNCVVAPSEEACNETRESKEPPRAWYLNW